MDPRDEKRMPFLAHLAELRHRIIATIIALGAGFFLAWFNIDALSDFVLFPANVVSNSFGLSGLSTLQVTEAFYMQLKLAIFAGLVFCLPFGLYQLFGFLRPALPAMGYHGLALLLLAPVFALLGFLFAYRLILPLVLGFFVNFSLAFAQGTVIVSLKSAFNLSLSILLVFSLVFQLPLVMLLLDRLGVISPSAWAKGAPIAFIACFVSAAILTPPDVISQVLLALPMLFWYFAGLFIMRISASPFVVLPTMGALACGGIAILLILPPAKINEGIWVPCSGLISIKTDDAYFCLHRHGKCEKQISSKTAQSPLPFLSPIWPLGRDDLLSRPQGQSSGLGIICHGSQPPAGALPCSEVLHGLFQDIKETNNRDRALNWIIHRALREAQGEELVDLQNLSGSLKSAPGDILLEKILMDLLQDSECRAMDSHDFFFVFPGSSQLCHGLDNVLLETCFQAEATLVNDSADEGP